jgi:hypothetical protein
VLVVECLGASTVILYGVNLLFVTEKPENEVCNQPVNSTAKLPNLIADPVT